MIERIVFGILALDDEEAGYAAIANMWLFNERLYIVIKSLAKLAAIMLYIFLADRYLRLSCISLSQIENIFLLWSLNYFAFW